MGHDNGGAGVGVTFKGRNKFCKNCGSHWTFHNGRYSSNCPKAKRDTYTNKERKEATLVCAIAACADLRYDDIVKCIDVSMIAENLAYSAWGYACKHYDSPWDPAVDGEAEALLRTGWSP